MALGGALILYALYQSSIAQQQPAPETRPAPAKPAPKPKKPKDPNCPSWGVAFQLPVGSENRKPQLGGLTSPDGTVHTIALPDILEWPENISSPPRTALGCCGFRVIDYQARFQNYPLLVDLPEKMVQSRIPGGAYPQKVAGVVSRFAPEANYYQDCGKNWDVLEACVKSQRLPAVDYNGRDPHYSMRIAHCVNVVACDREHDWVAILDNNHPQTDEIVWMSCAEFGKRWGGWCYCLLNVAPGYCAGSYPSEKYELAPNDAGEYNFGLVRKGDSYPSYCKLDNEDSTPEAILAAIGPAMAPLKVEVDHQHTPLEIDLNAKQLLVLGGAALLAYGLFRKEQS